MRSRKGHWGRRSFLAGVGGAFVGLPLFESLGQASTNGIPKRLLFIVTQNGTYPAEHWPTGSESDFTLSTILSPLEPYKDRMVLFKGIDNKAAMATGINGHTDGIRCMFTGRTAANNENSDYTAAGGISIDQYIANEVGTTTAFKSLEFQIGSYASNWPNFTSYYDAFQPAFFESHAQQFWDRIFAGVQPGEGPDPALLQLKANRQSILDAVKDQYTALEESLSAADRERLDAHLTQVREMERRIAETEIGAGCIVPGRPASNGMDDMTEKVGVDMIAYALSCDLTRVSTIGYTGGGFGFLGVPGNYHDDWLHNVLGNATAQQHVITVKTWQTENVKYLLDQLASIPEGDGTLFDNTLVVWADEFCHGYSHQHHEIPYALFSGSDDLFEMGRYIQYGTARSNNELWISIADAFGADGSSFGDPQFGSTPLPGL